MTVVTPFSRESIRDLNKDIQDALNEVAKKHGIEIRLQPGTFYPQTYNGKFEASMSQKDKTLLADADQTYYNEVAPKLGIDITKFPFGKVVEYGRDRYQITGLQPNSKKYPIKVMRVRDRKDGFGLPLQALIGGVPELPEIPV